MAKTSKNKPFRSLIASESGFTLIDASVALVIGGLLVASIGSSLMLLNKNSKEHETHARLYGISYALDNYYSLNGSYPCPADPTLSPDNPNHGQQNLALCNMPPTTPGFNALIAQGAIPFKALRMTEKEALDGWGNKFTYAVSVRQTARATFTLAPLGTSNGINIRDCSRATDTAACIAGPTNPTGANAGISRSDYHVLFFSHGEKGIGAYNSNGIRTPCMPANGVATVETENCDDDPQFVFDAGLRSDADNANYYDDVFFAATGNYFRVSPKMWARGTDPNNIGPRNVYVGINNYEATAQLDVKGSVLLERSTNPQKRGQSHANSYLNNAGETTRPEIIAGIVPEMRCSTNNTGMKGLAHNRAQCSNYSVPIPTKQQCPGPTDENPGAPQQYVVGISPGGTVICQ